MQKFTNMLQSLGQLGGGGGGGGPVMQGGNASLAGGGGPDPGGRPAGSGEAAGQWLGAALSKLMGQGGGQEQGPLSSMLKRGATPEGARPEFGAGDVYAKERERLLSPLQGFKFG